MCWDSKGREETNSSHEANNDDTQDCGWRACSKGTVGHAGCLAVNHAAPGLAAHYWLAWCVLWGNKDNRSRKWKAGLQRTPEPDRHPVPLILELEKLKVWESHHLPSCHDKLVPLPFCSLSLRLEVFSCSACTCFWLQGSCCHLLSRCPVPQHGPPLALCSEGWVECWIEAYYVPLPEESWHLYDSDNQSRERWHFGCGHCWAVLEVSIIGRVFIKPVLTGGNYSCLWNLKDCFMLPQKPKHHFPPSKLSELPPKWLGDRRLAYAPVLGLPGSFLCGVWGGCSFWKLKRKMLLDHREAGGRRPQEKWKGCGVRTTEKTVVGSWIIQVEALRHRFSKDLPVMYH